MENRVRTILQKLPDENSVVSRSQVPAPPRPARPLCSLPRAPGGGGGGGGRRGRDGSRRSRRPGPAAQTQPAPQPPAAPPPTGAAPQPSSAAAAARRGRRSATREPRVTARPPEPQPGLPERRPRSRRSDARTRSHLLQARGQDTMRSALTRSALGLSALLLLLLPLRSLSEGEVPRNVSSADGTIKPANANQSPTVPPASGKGQMTTVKTTPTAVPTTTDKRVTSATAGGRAPVASGSSGPTQASTAVVPADKDEKDSGNSRTPTGDPKVTQGLSSTTLPPTTKSIKPGTTAPQSTGAGGSPGGTTSHTTTKGGEQTSSLLPDLVRTSSLTNASPAVSTPTSPHQPTASPATSKPPGSPSEGTDKISTVASSSLGTKTGPTSPLHGAPTTPTPPVTLHGNPQKSSMMPAVTGTSSSITVTTSSTSGTSSSTTGIPSVPATSLPEAPQPAVPSLGPVATSPVQGPRSPSTQLTSTTPRVSNVPPPSSAHRDDRIKCESPERLTDTMLVLNLTKTSLCAGNSSSDDKLVTLLCRAAKATFNPVQDKCHIQLVPIQDSQAVAIKEIAVQTNLLPRNVYESLKDKWDELKEVGVSNMKLGDEGPPEETEDRFSMPLIITIVCMASFLLLVAALYGCCHQRLSQRKDQQRLTEELQTVENGYHDNPTLEVMETSSEMQEKKVVNLNGELGDSWIVPLDNLAKDDLDEEEDTHL
ncbi:podocalyxin [Ursus arctos]|uniref:podocalyxin n=1 Tax=Ursus arctos TaxID=9644 RepID=UPI002017256A|nr:podocalyxin [Ursus arctos]